MALGAVLGAALQTPATLTHTLTLEGVSVLRQPGVAGGLYGTDLDSIHVQEAGPGGVSTMDFQVDDPADVLSISDGARVVYWNHFRDVPVFVGSVDTATERPLGVGGKTITVRAVGQDARLDWGVAASDITFAAGTSAGDAIQTLVALAVGLGAVNAARSGGLSSRDQPIAAAWFSVGLLADAVTITGGTTVREAIRQICAQAFPAVRAADSDFVEHAATIDPWGGLRVMTRLASSAMASDWTDWTVDSRAGGILGSPATGLELVRNASQVRAVYIRGGAPAGSGVISDGSGKPGATALLVDETLTTAAGRDAAGAAYLAQYAGKLTGRFRVQDRAWSATVGTQVRAGSRVQIYDDALAPFAAGGVASVIMSIDKSYTDALDPGGAGPLETWDVTIGALPPSLAALLRRLSDRRPS